MKIDTQPFRSGHIVETTCGSTVIIVSVFGNMATIVDYQTKMPPSTMTAMTNLTTASITHEILIGLGFIKDKENYQLPDTRLSVFDYGTGGYAVGVAPNSDSGCFFWTGFVHELQDVCWLFEKKHLEVSA